MTSTVDTHQIVRTRHFPIQRAQIVHSLTEVITVLHLEKATGKMTLNLNQGAPNGEILFEERAVLKEF